MLLGGLVGHQSSHCCSLEAAGVAVAVVATTDEADQREQQPHLSLTITLGRHAHVPGRPGQSL